MWDNDHCYTPMFSKFHFFLFETTTNHTKLLSQFLLYASLLIKIKYISSQYFFLGLLFPHLFNLPFFMFFFKGMLINRWVFQHLMLKEFYYLITSFTPPQHQMRSGYDRSATKRMIYCSAYIIRYRSEL